MFIHYWNDFLGESSKHGVKLSMWKTAVFSKARNCFYLNLVQLNYVNWFVHLDLTAPDRLFSNFINYQKKKKMLLLIRRLKQPIPHGFTRTQTIPAAYGLS